MRLRDYILTHYDGNNAAFGRDNGLSRMAISRMVNKGTYYIYDGLLMIARREIGAGSKQVESTEEQLDIFNKE